MAHFTNSYTFSIAYDGDTLNVSKLVAGSTLRLVSTGSIYDVSTGGYAASATGYLSLVADGSIGTSTTPFKISLGGTTSLFLLVIALFLASLFLMELHL